MSLARIAAIALMTLLLPSVVHAQGGPVAFSAHHETMNAPQAKCLDKSKLAFVQFNSGPIQESAGFLAAEVRNFGTFIVYCLPNGNQSFFIVLVAATGGNVTQHQEAFRRQIHANP